MTNNSLKRAVGTFFTRQDAEEALMELRDAGFNMDQISAIAQNPQGEDNLADVEVQSSSERAKDGAETGAVMGATTGGVLGLIGSLSILAIPGVGVATEVAVLLGNALLGSGIGAAGGSLVGALVGWGIPEEQAQYYNELLAKGSYIVLVEGTEAEINGAEAILLTRKIYNWNVYNAPGNHNLMGI
ncbi:general stress protein [Pleurocapsa sp. PCC 7319]|uniref:general stress protein n=1 Tax=Pleurocapsa sp. PCC 7319 TaxID=118161 RepID=UPI00034D7BB5|nr:general stress protein [Pleurocapsa sp. PCC 7319]